MIETSSTKSCLSRYCNIGNLGPTTEMAVFSAGSMANYNCCPVAGKTFSSFFQSPKSSASILPSDDIICLGLLYCTSCNLKKKNKMIMLEIYCLSSKHSWRFIENSFLFRLGEVWHYLFSQLWLKASFAYQRELYLQWGNKGKIGWRWGKDRFVEILGESYFFPWK